MSWSERRAALARRGLVWRLTLRRFAHWVVLRARLTRSAEARQRREDDYAIRSAEDVARVFGEMKGGYMKLGQMASFMADSLPAEASAALAALRADAPPMAPSLAEGVVHEELGAAPSRLFLDWSREPVAAASIGQVHRAVLHDGRRVAVKVQYPGVGRALTSDLDDIERIFRALAGLALKGMDAGAVIGELRTRMTDELDYRLEARSQSEFWERYRGHPFIRVPAVVAERSAGRVLTTEWVDGRRWDDLVADPDGPEKEVAAEILARFVFGSVYRYGCFNGDPHPGNYLFRADGTVAFLDFGLVKRWVPGELEPLSAMTRAALAGDGVEVGRAAVAAGFLPEDHGIDVGVLAEYVAVGQEPYAADVFTFEAGWTGRAMEVGLDPKGRFAPVVRNLNLPSSFVVLDRVTWGLYALLAQLGATNRWGAIVAEYRDGAEPATDLGVLEARWWATREPEARARAEVARP